MEIKFSFEGARELETALKELPKSVASGALNAALKKAAEPMVAKARALAPVDTGALRKSIKAHPVPSKQRAYAASIAIGPDRKHFYGAILEKGTGPRKVKKTGKMVGSIAAHPFLRPAFDAHKEEAQKIFREVLWEIVVKKAQQYLNRRAVRAAR